MVDVDKQPTRISEGPFHLLEVHWDTYWAVTPIPDNKLQKKAYIIFSIPPSSLRGSADILSMSPATALNLLNWLAPQRETLETLAQEAQANG